MPYYKFGDICTIVDPYFPDRDGSYFVRSVNYKFGVGGFRQTLTLDYKVNLNEPITPENVPQSNFNKNNF